jgi:hypothetical protein
MGGGILDLYSDYLLVSTKKATATGLAGLDLREVFCFEHKRVVSNDFVIRFEGRLFQITAENPIRPRPRERVLIGMIKNSGY